MESALPDRIGIERLCCFGAMPPVEFVELAARMECRFVGIGLTAMSYYNPEVWPHWSLRDDEKLRREMRSAMRATGVQPSLCEGFAILPGVEAVESSADLDLVAELGCHCINLVSSERDKSRAIDQFVALSELAQQRGILVTSEIGMPPLVTLAAGLRLIGQVRHPNFRLLLDTMHFFRMGSVPADLVGHEDAIGYVQLADAPRSAGSLSYMEEALHERLPPGTGELPLRGLLPLLPADVVMGIEVPQRSLAAIGVGPDERIRHVVERARSLVASAPAPTRA
jgi:sugar phosphate isomerase/epimerase